MKAQPKARDTASAPSKMQSLLDTLRHPVVDRLIALLVCLPFLGVIINRVKAGIYDIPRAVIVVEMLLQILPMLLRRTPQRISSNSGYWLLAIVSTYWPFAVANFAAPGRPLLAPIATALLGLVSLAGTAYARLSLGRNISLVPAQRQLVRQGAYRFVRHPVYTMSLIAYVAFVLSAFSATNALMISVGGLLLLWRSFAEERFLAGDDAYRDYMRRVRWRWIPGIA